MSKQHSTQLGILVVLAIVTLCSSASGTEWNGPPPDTMEELFLNTTYDADDDTENIESFFEDPPEIGGSSGTVNSGDTILNSSL